MIIIAIDYDPAVRIRAGLPAHRDLFGHGPRIPAESKARCEVWRVNEDLEGILAGLEVDRLDAGCLKAIWGVAVGYDGVET